MSAHPATPSGPSGGTGSATGSGGGPGSLSGRKEMKRADRRSSITVLVLGDEGVGKSSLISTFVARYFSDVVPGLMTRVEMPPDAKTGCVTSIVDSQQGDAALEQQVQQQHAQQQQVQQEAQQRHQQPQPQPPQPPNSPAPAAASTAAIASRPSVASAVATMHQVDSIVLVYDLDRAETFFRLENHWLPLIERAFQGRVPVIVAENKVDLYRPSGGGGGGGAPAAVPEEQALARRRQQIVSLMQRYPFVRQCLKVSAKNLLRVDEVFLKAQQAVLYPFTPPLYDLSTGQLSPATVRALSRIFRIYDQDHDGLLSDDELVRFQRDTYHKPVFARDLQAWKKVVARAADPPTVVCVVDNRFTPAGFCGIFDVLMTQNRLDVVWEALRAFGYDDDLNLNIPESVTWAGAEDTIGGTGTGIGGGIGGGPFSDVDPTSEGKGLSQWKLSSPAKHFLAGIFYQFDSNKDGVLSPEDLLNIFSILPHPALPPWHPVRAKELFQGCFSVPKYAHGNGGALNTTTTEEDTSQSSMSPSLILPGVMSTTTPTQPGMSMVSSGDSFPSDADPYSSMSSDHAPGQYINNIKQLKFLEWMGYWHVLSAISPSVTREELFRLGHIEDYSNSHKKKTKSRRWKSRSSGHPPLRAVSGVPEASLRSREIRILVLGSRGSGKTAVLNYLRGDSSNCAKTKATIKPETSTACVKLMKRSKHAEAEEIVVHLVFTDVPETAAASQETYYRQLTELFGSVTSPKDRVCDLAMLVFDCTVSSSFTYAKELESTLLTKETPRVFVGTKADQITTTQVLDIVRAHCLEEDLEEQPLITSALDSDFKKRESLLKNLARCALNEPGLERLKSRPYEEQERREAERRKRMLWLGGFVIVGVVVGVGWLWGSSGRKDNSRKSGGLSWLRHIFGRHVVEETVTLSDLHSTSTARPLT